MATIVDTVYLNGCNYQIGYDLISQSVANNTSRVKYYGILNVTNSYISWSSGTATVGGNTVSLSTRYNKGTYTLVTEEVTVSHNENGDYVDGKLYGNLNTTFVKGSCSGNVYLPHINRGAEINTFTGNDVDGNFKVTYTTRASGFTYKLKLSIQGGQALETKNSYASGTTFKLTTASKDIVYNYAKTKKLEKVPISAVIETYSGSTKIMTSSTLTNQCSLGSISKIYIGGSWKRATLYVRVGSSWKRAIPYIRSNNQWKRGK